MICIIRIRGKVKLDRDVKETFDRMRLGRKYSCIVIHPNKEQKGMIKKLRNLVSFGEINRETFEKLLERRGQKTDKKKLEPKKMVEELEKGKNTRTLALNLFQAASSKRRDKQQATFPKRDFGRQRRKINELVLRML